MVECSIVFVESGHCVLLISEVQDILFYHFCFHWAVVKWWVAPLVGSLAGYNVFDRYMLLNRQCIARSIVNGSTTHRK